MESSKLFFHILHKLPEAAWRKILRPAKFYAISKKHFRGIFPAFSMKNSHIEQEPPANRRPAGSRGKPAAPGGFSGVSPGWKLPARRKECLLFFGWYRILKIVWHRRRAFAGLARAAQAEEKAGAESFSPPRLSVRRRERGFPRCAEEPTKIISRQEKR